MRGADTVNPAGEGTKVAARTRLACVPAGGQAAVLVRLTGRARRPSLRRRWPA